MISNIKALKRLSHQESTSADFSTWMKQVNARTNDRGAAILLASNVELGLDRAINAYLFFAEPRLEGFYADEGPINTFNRKIQVCRALRVYGSETYANLNIIRHVRNAFAHAHAPVSFKTKEIVAICNDLVEQELLYPRAYRKRKPNFKRYSARKKYEFACNAITHNLIIQSLNPTKEVHQNALKENIGRRPDDEFFFRVKPLP